MQSQRRVSSENDPPGGSLWPGGPTHWGISTEAPNPWASNASYNNMHLGLPSWPASYPSFAPLEPPSLPRNNAADFISANLDDQMIESPIALEQPISIKIEPNSEADTDVEADAVPDQPSNAPHPPGRHPLAVIVQQRNENLQIGPKGPLIIRRISEEELRENTMWVNELSARGLIRPVPGRTDADLLRHTDPNILRPPRHHNIDWETANYVHELPWTLQVDTPTDHTLPRPDGIDLTFEIPKPRLTDEQLAHRREYMAASKKDRRAIRKQGEAFRKDLTEEEYEELYKEQLKLCSESPSPWAGRH